MCGEMCTRVRGLSRERRKKLSPINHPDSQRKVQAKKGSASQPILPTPGRSWATKTDSIEVSPPPGYHVVTSSLQRIDRDPEVTTTSKCFEGPSMIDHTAVGVSFGVVATITVPSPLEPSSPSHSASSCSWRDENRITPADFRAPLPQSTDVLLTLVDTIEASHTQPPGISRLRREGLFSESY